MQDLISRQAAIDAMKNRWKKTRNYEGIGDDIAEECELYLKQVPSAQPATSCSEFPNSSDCISRQAAIDALEGKITVTRRANAKAVREYANTVCDRICRLPSAQRWIPCSERLPDKAGRYLTTCSKWGTWKVDWNIWVTERKPQWLWDQGVIAWMPMPEPYKGGEDVSITD